MIVELVAVMNMISQTENQILSNVYYDVSNPAGYGSVNAVYNAAKKELPALTRNKVKKYLQMQDTYTLHSAATHLY